MPFDPDAYLANSASPSLDDALALEGVSGHKAEVIKSIYSQESSSGKNTKTSNAGAVGGMQIIPATFNSVADKGWDINNPLHNLRGGIRYASQMYDKAGGDPALTGAGYYGGEGGLNKASKGIAVNDPRNPTAPNTLQYGEQIAGRVKPSASFDPDAYLSGSNSSQPAQSIAPVAPKPNSPAKDYVSGFLGNGGTLTPLSFREKLMKGVTDPISGGAQLLTNALPHSIVQGGNNINNWLADKTGLVANLPEGGVDQAVKQDEAIYQARRQAFNDHGVQSYDNAKKNPNGEGVDGARLLGNIVSPANIGLAYSLPTTAGAGLMARAGVSALGGAEAGALTPVTGEGDFWKTKRNQVAIGAGSGAALPLVTGAAARLISPKASTNPDIALLKAEGVRPTIGQALGGRWNAAEEKLQSVPLMGDMIANARNNTIDKFNTAAINRTLTPIGQKIEGQGQKAVMEAGNLINNHYDAGKKALGGFQLDNQAINDISQLGQLAKGLQPKEQAKFNQLYKTMYSELSPNGSFLADGFKRIDSTLGKEAKRYSGSTDAYQQELGDALKQMKSIIMDNAKRANPKAAEMMNNADRAWANLVRVEDASKRAGNNNGVFTPGQLNLSIKGTDQSVRGRAFSRGQALMQDLGNAGQNVLGNKIADSGTAGRLMIGVGGLATGAINPAIPAGLLAGAGLYTNPMQSLLTNAVTSRPAFAEPLANGIRKVTPMLSPVLGEQFAGLLN